MPADLSYEQLNDQMAGAIPALEEAYRRELDWWDEEPAPSHVIFGEIFNPYLSRLLAEAADEALGEIFAFLERMAADIDPRVQDVLRDTVLEHVRDEAPERRELAASYMGPSTLHHWREVSGTR